MLFMIKFLQFLYNFVCIIMKNPKSGSVKFLKLNERYTFRIISTHFSKTFQFIRETVYTLCFCRVCTLGVFSKHNDEQFHQSQCYQKSNTATNRKNFVQSCNAGPIVVVITKFNFKVTFTTDIKLNYRISFTLQNTSENFIENYEWIRQEGFA